MARAYLDQLNRSKSLAAARASAVKSALDKADSAKKAPAGGNGRGALEPESI